MYAGGWGSGGVESGNGTLRDAAAASRPTAEGSLPIVPTATDAPATAPVHARLAVLLSGSGRTLENLLVVIARGELAADVVMVVASKPEVRGIAIAEAAGVPVATLQRRDFPDDAAYSAAIFRTIGEHRPHLALCAGFLRKLVVPAAWDGRILNIHPALLPESGAGGRGYYGDRVHAAVLASGATRSGATVHVVDNEYDHGPAVLRAEVAVLCGDTVETLGARVFAAEQKLYPAAIRAYLAGNPELLTTTPAP